MEFCICVLHFWRKILLCVEITPPPTHPPSYLALPTPTPPPPPALRRNLFQTFTEYKK